MKVKWIKVGFIYEKNVSSEKLKASLLPTWTIVEYFSCFYETALRNFKNYVIRDSFLNGVGVSLAYDIDKKRMQSFCALVFWMKLHLQKIGILYDPKFSPEKYEESFHLPSSC